MNTFEINIQRKSGNHWPIVVEHSRPGELLSSRSEGTLELTPDDLQKLISLLGQPKDYGTFLGKALFREEIRDAFVSALRNSEATLRVLLFIEAEDREIRTLRWERLCGNIDDGWHLLSLEQRTPFSLYIPAITDRRFPPIGKRDLRALILVASPSEIDRYSLESFDVEAAVTGVRQALGEIPSDVLAPVADAIGEPTLDELCKHLTDRTKQYTLLHFVSHSRVILDSGETVLYWAKENNKVDPVTGTRLIERLRSLKGAKGLPHFTFFSTCESASPEAEAALGGLGQRLVRDLGMPAVIAMTEKVTVKTALALGAKFYEQLRKSGEVDSALHEAVAGLAERGDVTVPALFSRLGGRPLFSDQLDRELTNTEIQYGLTQLEKLLLERSPVLSPRLSEPAQKLRNSIETDVAGLSKLARYEREQALAEINTLCEEIIDLSFNALALEKQPPAYDARCPFLGLYPFREENREFFFGREQLIAQLQEKLKEDNFLAVLGASGSGKSSVVLAGLIPTLQKQQPNLVVSYMTPSNNPIGQLQTTLAYVDQKQLEPLAGGMLENSAWDIEREWVATSELATQPEATSVSVTPKQNVATKVEQTAILVIDQFEELFTLCTNETERLAFIERILQLSQQQKVVITMRADFWGECAPYRQLKELMEARQKLIGPMDTAELRKAMEMQAAKVGLRFEAGLSNVILDDVKDEPGAMPLLQHALLELWKRRHGKWLQTQEYEAIGGVKMAIAQTADDVYNTLSQSEQEQVKNIFIRLTRLDDSTVQGEKRRDTRRRVWLDELVPAGGNIAMIKELVNRLAGEGARLVVTSIDGSTNREELEVAHEALIRYWPRLLNWLDENRTNLQLRETIRQAALEWDKYQKDDNYLVHRGGRLDDARVLAKQAGFLNQLEADYVNGCLELRLRQEQEKEARRRREIRTAWGVAIGAVIALIVSGTLGIVAWIQMNDAKFQKHQADSKQKEVEDKQKEVDDTKVEQLVISSLTHFDSHQELDGLIAAIKAGKILTKQKNTKSGNYLQSTIVALQKIVDEIKERNHLQHEDTVYSVVFSPDGQTIASASGKTVQLWDLNGKLQKTFPEEQNEVYGVVFSPDGQTIAYTSGKTVKLWDLDGNLKKNFPEQQEQQSDIYSAVFSPDGQTIATINDGNTVKFWDLNGSLKKTFSNNQDFVISLFFTPNGQPIATVINNNTIQAWDLNSNLKKSFSKNQDSITNITFSPDGQTIATVSDDNTVKLWDLNYNIKKIFPKTQDVVTNLIFSPDGQTIATISDSDTVKFWDLNGHPKKNFPENEDIAESLAFSPDGHTIATVSDDNTVELWDLSIKKLPSPAVNPNDVYSIVLNHNGQTIAAAKFDNNFKLSNISKQKLPSFKLDQKDVKSVSFSHDSQTITAVSNDSVSNDYKVNFWDLKGQLKQSFKPPTNVKSITVNPDGQTVATISDDNSNMLKMLDLKGNRLTTFKPHNQVKSVTFSPDGKTVATISDDNSNNALKMLDLKGNLLTTFKPQTQIKGVIFSPDSKTVATISDDNSKNTLKLFDLKGNPLKTFKPQTQVDSVVFSPNSKTIAIITNYQRMKLLNLNGNPIRHFNNKSNIKSVAFNHDGSTIASVNIHNKIKLLDLNGKLLRTFKPQAAIQSLVFSPDGKNIAFATDNGVTVWDWDLNSLMVSGCDWARDYLKNSAEVEENDRNICDGIGTN